MTAAVVPTRAFYRQVTEYHRPVLWVARRRKKVCWFETGTAAGALRTASRKTFRSEADADAAFTAACRKKLAIGFVEVVANIAEGRFEPRAAHLFPWDVSGDLIETARAALPSPSLPKTVVEADRTQLLDKICRDAVPRSKTVHSKGLLALPTGRLVATDPFHMSESASFDVELPPGDYSVRATMVDDVVIAASIAIADSTPTRWELALTRGVKKLVRDRSIVSFPPLFGFSVDVAMGAFMDARVADRLDDDDDARERLVNRLARSRTALCIARVGKADNAAVFRTGLGDGLYGVYFGYRRNRVVQVVADFGAVIERWGEIHAGPSRLVNMDGFEVIDTDSRAAKKQRP